ncbi:serine threonine protein kinase CMGC group [Trichoderma citrinoviride]|uniref:dual-specificity kinase n=1 Tax=Trichoderma citrinoviride TaxID=58853 RepID=A0A2T4BAE5_9HYPO|nr:serine threonine protein kinase CMGC group [Trichoderma citrinoviride]PTB66295.1 serine threonine protein kinase CMGC group [Trichoderma citrinoviride]
MSTPTTAQVAITLPHYRYLHHPPSHHDADSSATARLDDSYTSAMPASTNNASGVVPAPARTAAEDQQQPSSSRKRRRSREPDWNTFYRNGLPKEIIVIDDTPEPEANTSRRIANGNAVVPDSAATAAAQSSAKKRRRDDQPLGYHVQYVNGSHTASHTNTPRPNTTPGGSTLSSDRTNSALNTTAPTSLSSNSQYDELAAPLKRKRTTRQQVANEAKRRDVDGLGGAFMAYKPPPFPPKKSAEVPVRVVNDRHYNKNTKVDDDDGHYIVVPDAELTDKYQIVRLLGQGTFGKVVEARDVKRGKPVAVKIIRSVQKYRDASRIELRVLNTLKANDEENRNRCIHLRDCFDYRGHICIVMDLLGQSVFDFLKGNGFVPFPNSQIQNFARQLFTSVAFLHDLNLIHTDLKPENILLCDNSYQTFTYNRKIPSSSTTINRQASQRRVLLDTEIRLIDFGSATFQDEYHSSVVSTRHYRAPEIILGLGWSFPCDIWSIGCILVEFFTGDALFQTHDNLEHLAMMEAVVGSRIDSHLVSAVNKMSTRSGGNPASKYFKRLKLDYPTPETTRGSRRFVKAMKHLSDIIPSNTTFFKNFLDLLRKIFVYDPAHRITAKQALNHPWFKEMAQPDDGTEAAKIRFERRRLEIDKARQHAHYVG